MFSGNAGASVWDQPLRWPNDNYAAWDPKNRKRTKNPDEAIQIFQNTGRMPRPLKLSDVRLNSLPLRKSIVASEEERRKAAEMVAIYAVTRLQARLLLRREVHPVWGHDRIMVYGKMVSHYLQPDANTNEPIEIVTPLKFKAAFREDYDPYFPSREKQWENELEDRGLRPDLVEGKRVENLLQGADQNADVPENMFVEAILDNVVDLGELVLQHFACHVDRESTSAQGRRHRLNRRLQKRLSKEMGIKTECNIQELEDEGMSGWTAQDLHDMDGYPEWNKGRFPR